jgi:glycosidase
MTRAGRRDRTILLPSSRVTRSTHAPVLSLVGALALAGGCSESPPRRDCFARVWIPRSSTTPLVVGSWDGWERPGTAPVAYDERWLLFRAELPPGEHGYLLRGPGGAALDSNNPLTTFRGEEEVSLLLVSDCAQPKVKIDGVRAEDDGTLRIDATFLASSSESPLDPTSIAAETTSGRVIPVASADPETGEIRLETKGLARGRHTVVVRAKDEEGASAEPGRAAAWVAPLAEDWRDGVLYQVVTDRFRGNGGSALAPPPNPGARAGGTLDGVTAEIERGTLESLGVTALWISPVYVNPTEAREGVDGHLYDAYHGYWPLESRAVDPLIGGREALDRLVASAHARGLRVLLDLVPNHVYEGNARYLEHRTDGWYNDEGCVCGTPSCPWGEFIQTCWFTPYLPDFRWQNREVMQLAVDDAEWWARETNVDGFRIDAVPMMPRAATRRVARGLRTETLPAEETFLVGEIFTGPGPGGIAQIRHHLGPAGLNSAFDFPLMWAIRGAVASGDGSFVDVESILAEGETAYAGSGAVMSLILGNHDTPRIVSVAAGDAFGDPWEEPAGAPTSPEPYRRQALAFALLFTLPGLPTVYYGDEVGLSGAGDPDSRRVMPADETLSAAQLSLRDAVRRLGTLRRCSVALRRGDRVPLVADRSSYAFLRAEGDESAVVLLSSQAIASEIALPQGEVPLGRYVDAVSGEVLEVSGLEPTPVAMEPLGYRVLLPEGDPCLAP